jgi:hypothetical protein
MVVATQTLAVRLPLGVMLPATADHSEPTKAAERLEARFQEKINTVKMFDRPSDSPGCAGRQSIALSSAKQLRRSIMHHDGDSDGSVALDRR